ncbi:DUF4142 domain-containing protein [Pseudoduganella sp. GCM10020061]|uniref:DUF4142 domain-containing protein n=1 Tax=Pseudoduganella sp. GCM10020061 TaxID=3317345 RepID=UPI003635984D
MVNSKFIRGIAGVSVLFAAVAVHAQVLQTDTRTDSQRDGTTPTTTRDDSSNTTQSGASTAGSTMQSSTAANAARLQQGVMQSSTRQSGTQQTGMENGRFDKGTVESGVAQSETDQSVTRAGTTQAGSSQAGMTQSGSGQSSAQRGDPSNVPAPTDRSRAAQDARSGITPESMSGRSGAAGTAASGGALGKADSKAIMDMAMANMAEVEMGKMAQSKGTSEQVKTFGQQMIDDHGKALAEVQALAQAKGVTLPTALDDKHRKEAAKLNALSGAAFDKAYMDRAGVKDHRTVHGMLNKIESSAKDPDVKAMAGKMKPVVQQHLNSAQQMSKAKTTSKPDTESGNR